jgi:hypothetical protein
VTDEVEASIGKLGLWVRKLEDENVDILPHLEDIVEGNSVKTSDTRTDQYHKDHLINVQLSFSKYFTDAVSDKYNWTIVPDHADSPPYLQFSLEEEQNYCDISETSLEVHSWRKPCIEFCVGTGVDFHPLSRKALNILLPFTPS